MKLKKGVWWLIGFNALYIIAFIIYYLLNGNYEFLIYIAALIAIALLVLFTLHRTHLDYLALWGLSIWGLLHMLGGGLIVNGQVLYRYRIIDIIDRGGDFFILKMDQAIHFYGFLVAAIVVFQLIYPEIKKYPRLAILLAFLGSMGLGAINEVVEFIAFVALAETGVGDLYNTGLDLIFNLLGALAGSIFSLLFYRNKTQIN